MTNENTFLKVEKRLLGKDLTPIEILIISQVWEYQSKDKECFISNETLAEYFGVSIDTVKRTLTKLEKKGILNRETKSSQKGKDRKMTVDLSKVQNKPCEEAEGQNAPCAKSKIIQ